MKKLVPILLLSLSLCNTPMYAQSVPLDLKKGERVIIYDQNHRRVGVVVNRGYGRTQIRNNANQITGYVEGNRIYDSGHRRTGTWGTQRK